MNLFLNNFLHINNNISEFLKKNIFYWGNVGNIVKMINAISKKSNPKFKFNLLPYTPGDILSKTK
jgi:hypothetical protein